MSAPRFYSCVLCSSRPKTRDRRKLDGPNNKQLRKFLQQKFFIESANLFSPGSVICNKCRLRCSREMGIAKSNNTDPYRLLCVPRKDPDYAPPNKVAKNAPKSPQALPYQYHQLEEATLSVLYVRDGVLNCWLYQLVLGIICFWTNWQLFS